MKNFEQLRKNKIDTYLSLFEKVYPNFKFDKFLNLKFDERYFLDFFSTYFNISKEKLLSDINKFLGIDYKINLKDLLNSNVKENIQNTTILKQFSFIPIINNSKLKSVITSNPFLLLKKFNIPRNVKIYLSTGKDINDFLENICVNTSNGNNLLKTLKSLVINLEEENINKIVFEKNGNEVCYSYEDKNNIWKKGRIINQDINIFWKGFKDFNTLILNKQSSFFAVRNPVLKSINNVFIFEWTIPKRTLSKKVCVGVISRDKKMTEKILAILKNENIIINNYENLSEFYKANKSQKHLASVIYLDRESLKSQEKIFKSNKQKCKSILIGLDGIRDVDAYLFGVDYYIDSNFSDEYFYEIMKLVV